MDTDLLTCREIYEAACTQLSDAGIEEAKTDAFLLLEHFCGMDRTRFLLRGGEKIPAEQAAACMEAVQRRSAHVPLQHITGTAYFMGLAFHVSPHVLIPRQDTELLAMEAIRAVKTADMSGCRLLDLCTGSGALAVSIGRECPRADITAADLSEEALAIARENAERLKVPVTFRQGDLFDSVRDAGEVFDVIVSNPPYVRTQVIETLEEEVRLHDPRMALDGGEDGLYFYRRIARESGSFLKEGGRLLLEIGYDQAADVTGLLEVNGFSDIRVLKDLSGNDRVVTAVCDIKPSVRVQA